MFENKPKKFRIFIEADKFIDLNELDPNFRATDDRWTEGHPTTKTIHVDQQYGSELVNKLLNDARVFSVNGQNTPQGQAYIDKSASENISFQPL